jgi:hypothetical protein
MCISFAITLCADDECEKAAEAEEVDSFCSDRSGIKGIVDIQPPWRLVVNACSIRDGGY